MAQRNPDRFDIPVYVTIDEDGDRYEAYSFRRYAEYIQLPDPTFIEMSDEVNSLVVAFVNEGLVSAWDAYKIGSHWGYDAAGNLVVTEKTHYVFNEQGREGIEFPSAEQMLTLLAQHIRNGRDAFVERTTKGAVASFVHVLSIVNTGDCGGIHESDISIFPTAEACANAAWESYCAKWESLSENGSLHEDDFGEIIDANWSPMVEESEFKSEFISCGYVCLPLDDCHIQYEYHPVQQQKGGEQ